VRRHSFAVVGAEEETRARAALAELKSLAAKVRVLRGLPAVIPPIEAPTAATPRKGKDGIAFEIVADWVSGPTLAAEMKKRPRNEEDVRRAVRIFRNLAAAVGLLHDMGMADVRPDPALVRLILPDEPVYLDILPLHPGKPREAEEDVRTLVRQLARWLGGAGGPAGGALAINVELGFRPHPASAERIGFLPRVRARTSIFPSRAERILPLGLDEFLTRAVTRRTELKGWKPSTLADRLQEFC
jgi:hypothetical protein